MQTRLLRLLLLVVISSNPLARSRAQQPQISTRLTLRESIDIAVENNLDLKVVRSGEQIAGYGLFVERARFDPAFTSATGYASRLSPLGGSELEGAVQNETKTGIATMGLEKNLATGGTLALRGDAYDERKTNSQFARLNPEFNARVSLDLRQPLLKNAGFTYNLAPIRLAELGLDRSNLEMQSHLLAVLRETELAYWLVVSTGRAREIRRNSIELGTIILDEAVEREKAALATRIDVLEARAAVAAKEEALLTSDKLHRDTKDRLFKVMGILLTQEPGDLVLERLPTDGIYTPDPQASFDRALAHAPVHLIALNAIRRREIERRQAKQNRLPSLDFVSRSGLLGRNRTQGTAYNRLTEANGYFWEVNLELRVPWGRRAEKARYAQSLALLDQERLTTDEIRLQLYADVRFACREVDLANQRLDATSVTLELNTEKFEQRKSEQSSGQTTMRDLLEAQEEMEESQLRHLEANVEILAAIARLAELEGTLPSRYGLLLAGDRIPEEESEAGRQRPDVSGKK